MKEARAMSNKRQKISHATAVIDPWKELPADSSEGDQHGEAVAPKLFKDLVCSI
jgi:hypothetical protein